MISISLFFEFGLWLDCFDPIIISIIELEFITFENKETCSQRTPTVNFKEYRFQNED
jgi:hypothetical protein